MARKCLWGPPFRNWHIWASIGSRDVTRLSCEADPSTHNTNVWTVKEWFQMKRIGIFWLQMRRKVNKEPLNTLQTYDCLTFCIQALVVLCVSRDVCITTMDEMALWRECWGLIHAKWYPEISTKEVELPMYLYVVKSGFWYTRFGLVMGWT